MIRPFATKFMELGIDIHKQPTFVTLARITVSSTQLDAYKKAMLDPPAMLKIILNNERNGMRDQTVLLRQVYAKILVLEKSVQPLSRFSLNKEEETNTGNNGVLQVLNNTIASYARKDFMNIDDNTMANMMDTNAIIIIDIQSFGDDILKLFFESILKKAVMRLRVGTPSPMSIFIDETNRVLSPSIDLHSDVLREARVELVVAIQNEEQMIEKFSETTWRAIRGNILHKYHVDSEHRISYNDNRKVLPRPMIINESKWYQLKELSNLTRGT